MSSRPFESKYRGLCPECGVEWLPGEAVQYNWEGQLVHAVCPDLRDVLRSWGKKGEQ